MAPMLDKLKNKSEKASLKAKLVLLEREAEARKKKFGIEFFDLVTLDKNKMLGLSAGTIFKGERADLKGPFESCREDIATLQAEKEIHQKDLDVLEVKGAHTLPSESIGQVFNKAGATVSNAAKATKLQGQKALLDRKMKIRKELLGVDLFETFSETEEKTGIKKKISQTLAGVTQHEKDIQSIIDFAKMEVAKINERITSKKNRIAFLDAE